MRDVLSREPWPAKNRGPQQYRNVLLARNSFLLWRHDLANFDRRDRHELLIHQIGARQLAVKRRPAFAQQVLDTQLLAQLSNPQWQIESLALAGRNHRNMRMTAPREQPRGSRGRGEDRRIHHVAIERLVPREIEVGGASDKDISLAGFAQPLAQCA